MNVRTRTAALVLAGAPLALALVACGSDDGDTGARTDTAPAAAEVASSEPAQATTTSPTTSAAPDDDTVLAAARTALAELDGTVVAIDRESGGWDVTVVTSADAPERDLLVSLDGTTVERGPVDDRDDDADDRAERDTLLAETRVDLVAAVGLARAEVPGSPVDSVELDLDDARATWQVQLGYDDTADQHEVTIDAATGDVLRVERDD
ncbi:PepSY domain-containing protein [Nocardioides sp. C4-1]|uniref:PepSY domain-containing protein n=1 Tax=Nocardioides sp. C4-1 TaxID=3151851 RepID=UPI003263FA39